MVTSPTIKKSNTFKSINQFRISLEGHIRHYQKYADQKNVYRQRMNKTDSKIVSICKELNIKYLNGTIILSLLIEAANNLEVLELLNIKQYEEEYVIKIHNLLTIMSNLKINLVRYQKQKLCEKYRNIVQEDLLIENLYLYIHYYNNYKPSIYIMFKVDSEKMKNI